MIPICTEIENLIHPVQLREDEYINESGLICCSKCRTPRQKRIEISGRTIGPRCLCKCQQAELEKREQEQKHQELKVKLTGCATQMQDRVRDIADLESTIRFNEERLEEAELGYVPNEKTEQEIAAELQRVSGKTLSERFRIKAEELEGQAEELRAELNEARMAYIAAYPSGGFTGGYY